MFTDNILNNNKSLRIIVAPLDWGLGHATRCIPIIHSLQKAGAQVFIAAEGETEALLKSEFPQNIFLPLKGYKVRYSKNGLWLKWKLLTQYFTIKSAIHNEHEWLKKMVKEFQINAVISDNRFGLSHSSIPGVFITHQLNIKTGQVFTDFLARRVNYSFIKRFDECWIPDTKEAGYGGVLSHPEKFPETEIQYMGLLSRLKVISVVNKYDFLFLISGPEPQRTIFENTIIHLITQNKQGYKIALVRGKPLREKELKIPNTDLFDHLSALELNNLIAASNTVICRSGYSSVMDLLTMGKKAILIPTPGQKEQEYLAEYLSSKSLFKVILQEDMKDNIFELSTFDIQSVNNNIDEFIRRWLEKISLQQ